MAKRELKGSKKADEAEARDEAQETEESGASEASARLTAAQQRRSRMRERIAAAQPHDDDHAHDHGHDHGHGHDHHEEEEIDTSNDPSWWVPHSVLGALVVVGILGFFGAFNSVAAKLGYKGMPSLAVAAQESHATSKPEQPKAPEPRPAPQPNQMQQPQREMFGAKHLLVMYKGSQRAPENVTRTKEEARARAEEARKKAKAGTKFEDLVKEYSDEPGAGQRGGDLGKFPKGRMVGPFQDGLEKTKVGEVSDLVETPFGFHVILRTQ